MKLGLGTVQFGQAYGIGNVRGVTPQEEAHAIIRRAAQAGIDLLDTAPRYGTAERVLGALGTELQSLRIVTKTPAYNDCEDPGSRVANSLRASLETLNLTQAYGLLEHRAEALLGDNGEKIWCALCEERDAGRVARIGISVYSSEELDAALERFPIELVQFPANIIDRRMLANDRLARLADRGIEIHVRSAFLQGALLAPPGTSAHIPGLSELITTFHAACSTQGCSPLEAALSFLQSIPEVDAVLIGIENCAQLEEILQASSRQVDLAAFDQLACDNPAIVDPSKWGPAL